MAKWFYTDQEAEQQGPIDDQTLLDLNQEGTIDARTLVWTEGMEEWEAFREIVPSLFGTDDDGVPVEIGVCAYSSRVYPISEMMPYGEALIGRDQKDAFVQRLMETGRTEIEDATEKKFDYVGFWWRCLSSFIDYLVKMIPTWICMIPYYVVMIVQAPDSGDNPSSDLTVSMGIAYGIGMLGMLAFSIWYETWMVGKYQATLGKLVIGARVVNPDGSRLGYKRAFIRWLAKKPMDYLILTLPPVLLLGLVIAGMSTLADRGDRDATFAMAMMAGLFIAGFGFLVCSGIYWMAAFDSEKRTLHDRVASTRVIRK